MMKSPHYAFLVLKQKNQSEHVRKTRPVIRNSIFSKTGLKMSKRRASAEDRSEHNTVSEWSCPTYVNGLFADIPTYLSFTYYPYLPLEAMKGKTFRKQLR